jgi:protein FAM32A
MDLKEEFEKVSRGKLKLKTDESDGQSMKKKKKKSKDKEKMRSSGSGSSRSHDKIEVEVKRLDTGSGERKSKLTKAELAFKNMQNKMQTKRIMEKASTTHKQQVEKFNEKLDSLTEHFDIPKVSWTK